MAYATLLQVKQALSDQSIDAKGDDNLERVLDAATKAVDRYVSRTRPRTFAASADTIQTFNVLDRVIGKTLYLQTDLAQVTTVKNDTVAVAGANYKLLADHPHTTAYNRIKLLTGSWSYTTSVYPDAAAEITGRFAYSVTAPDDIIQACIQLCIAVWRQRNTVANISTAMVSADGTLVLPDGLPKSVVDLLEPFVV